MLGVGFAITSVTVLLGGWLLAARRGTVALVHALCGTAGVGVTLLAWRDGALAGAFGMDALVLLGAALAAGLVLAAAALRRRRPADAALVLHVALAGIGYLLLAGFALG